MKKSKDGLAKLLSLRVRQLKEKKEIEWLGLEIQTLWIKKEVDIGDFLSLQENIPMGDFIELAGFLKRNDDNEMFYNEALDLARRYHFMILAVLVKEFPTPTFDQKSETFRKYEKMVDSIFNGEEGKDKIEFLKTLPSWRAWDGGKAYKMYLKSPFKEKENGEIGSRGVGRKEPHRKLDSHPKKRRNTASPASRRKSGK